MLHHPIQLRMSLVWILKSPSTVERVSLNGIFNDTKSCFAVFLKLPFKLRESRLVDFNLAYLLSRLFNTLLRAWCKAMASIVMSMIEFGFQKQLDWLTVRAQPSSA